MRDSMEGDAVLYCGRIVSTVGFRTFIYGINDTQKLVESWPEYQENISSGTWFATKEQAAQYTKLASEKPIDKGKKHG